MLERLRTSALVLVLAPSGLSAQGSATPQPPPTPVKATPQNAAAFVGEWDLSGQGSNGPASFTFSLNPQGETLPSDDKVLMHIEVANGLAQLDGAARKKIQK